MVKNHNLFTLSIIIILLVGFALSACTNEPKAGEMQETNPSPMAGEVSAAVTMPPTASPTLAAPVISVSTAETAVPEPTDKSVEIVVETAVSTTEAPVIVPPEVPPPTPGGANIWTLNVPILMYHYISVPPPDADIYRTDLSVTPENFRQQMAYLAENGYTPIDLYQLSAAITAKTDLPEKPVILTFDDGYLDNYENAFPILQEFGFIGTFFVITDLADQGAEGYANWEQLKEMAAAGMRIETHTKSHPDLTENSRDGIIFQVLGSQETIAAHIGYTPRYLCYPGGRYSEETMQILKELDLWGATTTQGGTWHGFEDRYEWSRQRVRHETTLDKFKLLVDLAGTVSGKTLAEN
jgi:peptidoglycan/xylan/chitin deacetylase (PgdA/CDA1 family)